ncbi:hypothetical protein ABZ260_07520, partial [Streptosporangium sp. NPDC006013]
MRSSLNGRRLGRVAAVLALPIALSLGSLPVLAEPSPPASEIVPDRQSSTEQNGVALLRVIVPDEAGIDRLNSMGVDLAEYKKPVDGGFEMHAILSPEEAQNLRDLGFNIVGKISDQTEVADNLIQRRGAVAAEIQAAAEVDTLTPLRAEWFTSLDDQNFLSIEVKSSAIDAATVLTVTWDSGKGTAPDSGGTATMSRFTDAGQYMYHRFSSPLALTAVPTKATITSNRGGTVTVPVTKWLGEKRKAPKKHYVADFVDRYMDPTEVTNRISGLAQEFPKISQIVNLPYKTNGYRRAAQAQFGTVAASTLYVTSKAYGHEGGNDISVALVKPEAPSSALSVSVSGKDVVVNLGTNESSAISSTAKAVVDALNGNTAASALLTAATYRQGREPRPYGVRDAAAP